MTARGERPFFRRQLPDSMPEDWEEVALSVICSLENGDNLPSKDRDSGTVPVFGSNGVVGSHSEANTSSPAIIVGRKGSAGEVNWSDEPSFVIDTAYYTDPDHSSCHLRWLFFALNSLGLDQWAEDSAIPGMNQEFIRSHEVLKPPRSIQAKITSFLDHQTSRIDRLIEKKQHLLELLKEKREAEITKAVTEGLTEPERRLKETESTLGEVKNGWDVTKLKFTSRKIIDSEHKTASVDSDGAYHIVRTSNVRDGRLLLNQTQRANEETYNEWTYRGKPSEGDLVFTREAPAGEVGIVPKDDSILLGQRTVLLRPDPEVVETRFLSFVLQNANLEEFINIHSRGSTVRHLNVRDVKEIPVPIPSLEEQKEIADYLERKDNQIVKLRDRIESGIDLLEEGREALITAAVTDEIDISNRKFPKDDTAEAEYATTGVVDP